MKKIRVLIMLLVVLLVPCLMFIACNDDEEVTGDCSQGHTWRFENTPNKQTLIQDATCTQPEIRERECKVCGTKEQYTSAQPSGHLYDQSKKIYLNDATCTENGHTINHCKRYHICGYEADLIEEVPGSAKGHTFRRYDPSIADPTIGVAKCVDCDKTDTMLLGIKMDMEGDRSHLSYQIMTVYTANLVNASEYKQTPAGNTYLSVARPDAGYLGGAEFGVILNPNELMTDADTYIFEATLMLDENKTNNDVVVVAKKALLNQQVQFIKYNKTDKTIDGLNGAVYALTADDYANGVNIAVAVNDHGQWYQIYVNNELVSAPITFTSDFFEGFALDTFEIVSLGTDETEFGVDNIKLYEADKPSGFTGDKNLAYEAVTLESGEQVSVKTLDKTCTHAFAAKNTVVKTCTTSGYVLQECSKCSGQRLADIDVATGHAYDRVNAVTVAPTCFEAGYKVSTCTVCGARNGEWFKEATGHTHGADATVVPATCNANAIMKGDCVVCGTYFEADDPGSRLDHQFGDDLTVTLPTCSEDGYTSGTCKRCGETIKDETTTVSKFGHYYFELSTSVTADCKQSGYDEFKCLSCGEMIKINEVSTTGHKIYTSVNTESGTTYVTEQCTRCPYSYTFAVSERLPTYSDVQTALSNKLLGHWYEDSALSKNSLRNDGGDPYENDSGMWKYGAWRNMNDNQFGRFISGSSGGDTYVNFPAADKGIKTNTVWEFDVKFPAEGEKYTDGVEYGQGGTLVGFSTNGGDGKGITPMRINPDGSVVVNNMKTGHDVAGQNFGKYGYAVGASYKTDWDIELAPAGTVNREEWTRIAVVLNYSEMTCTCYVNGVSAAPIILPDTFAVKVRYIRFNFFHTGVLSALDFCNMNYYNGTKPVYVQAPADPVDFMMTNFAKDNGDSNIADISGNLELNLVPGLVAGVAANRLNYTYTKPAAGGAAGGKIYGDVSYFSGTTYTLSSEVEFNNPAGKYDIVNLTDGTNTLPIVYMEGNKIKITGTEYERVVSGSNKIRFDVVVRDGLENYDVYIEGVLVAENVSFASTAYGTAEKTDYTLELFKIKEDSDSFKITVSKLCVYRGDVVPSYYAGRVQEYSAPGYKDTAVSFDGTENILDILPANSMIPGGYYYTNVQDQSYLALVAVPATQNMIANIRYTKVDGSGVIGGETGYNTVVVSDFKNAGVCDLKFNSLFGLKYGEKTENEATVKGYDISAYSKMITRFYINDTTKNYVFKIVLYTESGVYTLFTGKAEKSTGWNILETAIPADAPDYITAIGIVFSDNDCGVGATATTVGNKSVDFTFALENISFEASGYVIENTEYIYNPRATCFAEGGSHDFGTLNTDNKNATCDKHGYTYRICKTCGYMELTITNRTGHKFTTEVEGKKLAPTCETDGYQMYACTCEAQSIKVLPKTQHKFELKADATETDGKKAATCIDTGYDVYVCTNEGCEHDGKLFLLETPTVGHAPAADATTTEKTPLTCTDNGVVEVSKCANCGESYEIVTETDGHDYEEVTVPANCTTPGESYKKCTKCDDIIDRAPIDATGHTAPAEYLQIRIPLTCQSASGWKYNCTVCGCEVLIMDEGVVPCDHDYGDWTIITAVTCGEDGLRDRVCKFADCGKPISEIGTPAQKLECIIAATGEHNYATEYTYSEDFVAGVRGEKWYACSGCSVPRGLEGAGTEGLVFTYNNVNGYVITGYTGNATELVIPAIYNGKPVIIGKGFAGAAAATITSVTIADGTLLSDGVFEGFAALETVKLPADLTALPTNAFSGCVALESIELPASCTEIRSGAFYGCTALKKITINGALTNVMMFAFAGCDALETVEYISLAVPTRVIATMGNDTFINAEWTKIAE